MAKKFVFNGLFTNEVALPNGCTKRYLLCDVTDVPFGLPLGVNPRTQNMGSRPVKAMTEALNHHEEDFSLLNGGIKILCKSIKAVGAHSIAINIDDTNTQGVVDGGHTYRTITEFVQQHPDYKKGVVVSIELITGDHAIERCVDIASARNTASQVKLISIMNAMGKFDPVKEMIKDFNWADEVSWEENMPGRIKGELLIALMMLFDIEHYGRRSGTHPCNAYNSFDGTLKLFNASISKGYNLSIYGKLVKILPKIVELHDYVQLQIPRWYNEAGGKYGALTSIEAKKPGKTLFSQEEMKYTVPEAVVMPILSSARMLLSFDDNGELVWSFNPYQFFDIVGRDCSRNLIRELCEYNDINKYLKLPKTWKDVYGDARDAYNDARGEL
jgi:hypothetical protein